MRTCTGEEDHKLFATKSAQHIAAAKLAVGIFRNTLEDLVANVMTKPIIDLFEVINVKYRDRQRPSMLCRVSDFHFKFC